MPCSLLTLINGSVLVVLPLVFTINFLSVVIKCIRGGEKAPAKPWDGAEGLEWTVPSPAPYHTFETPPKID